jgi:hypothetical protein
MKFGPSIMKILVRKLNARKRFDGSFPRIKMLVENMSEDLIVKITGLPVEQIRKIKAEFHWVSYFEKH